MRLFLCCVLTVAAFAQGAGTITGRISDTFGKPVSGARIQLKNGANGALHKGASTATGEYTLDGLPSGTYELSVRMNNMENRNPTEVTGPCSPGIDVVRNSVIAKNGPRKRSLSRANE